MLCIGLKSRPNNEQIPYDDITDRKTQNRPMKPKSGCKDTKYGQYQYICHSLFVNFCQFVKKLACL